MSEVFGFAHRGGAHGPNNAIQTFVDALARGARGLETDAWLSADGVVVLDHDGVADVATRQSIADVRSDQLPAHLSTLDELYETCGTDYELAIDVKTDVVAGAIAETALRHGAADRLWVVAPYSSIGVLDALPAGHRAVTVRGEVLRNRRRRNQAFTTALSCGVEAVNARWPWWNASLVEQVHSAGMLAFGYDAQSSFALRRCVALGLDGVFSDHVDRMLSVIGSTAA